MKLTVFFDPACQMWVGIIEEREQQKLKASRHVFHTEPKDVEILDFVKHDVLDVLGRSTVQVEVNPTVERKRNAKRLAREAAREMAARGVSAVAQAALKLDLEQRKKQNGC